MAFTLPEATVLTFHQSIVSRHPTREEVPKTTDGRAHDRRHSCWLLRKTRRTLQSQWPGLSLIRACAELTTKSANGHVWLVAHQSEVSEVTGHGGRALHKPLPGMNVSPSPEAWAERYRAASGANGSRTCRTCFHFPLATSFAGSTPPLIIQVKQ